MQVLPARPELVNDAVIVCAAGAARQQRFCEIAQIRPSLRPDVYPRPVRHLRKQSIAHVIPEHSVTDGLRVCDCAIYDYHRLAVAALAPLRRDLNIVPTHSQLDARHLSTS